MSIANKDPLAWGRYAAVAGAYAACYELTRNLSFSHWMLPAGLRLACLLLVPRRFWPALAVGETLPIAEMAVLHGDAFGWLWAAVVSLPPILMCMPAVAWLQRHMRFFHEDGAPHVGMILMATLACAAVNAAVDASALAVVHMADGSPPPPVTLRLLLAWLLGAYLGALTLTPMILAIRERVKSLPRGGVTLAALRSSELARDAVLFVVPCLALLLLGSGGEGGSIGWARLGMVVPVVLLTLRHGWHGAAVGGMLASVAQAATSFELQDPAMIRAQAVLALAISSCLIFGLKVTRRQMAMRRAAELVASTSGR